MTCSFVKVIGNFERVPPLQSIALLSYRCLQRESLALPLSVQMQPSLSRGTIRLPLFLVSLISIPVNWPHIKLFGSLIRLALICVNSSNRRCFLIAEINLTVKADI